MKLARPGRPRTIDDDQIAAVIERTLRSTPEDSTHWSIRSMAAASGYSHPAIRRIWTAFGLQPHLSQTFKLSSDSLFVNKVRDIVGLYLSPPNPALVLIWLARRPHYHVHFTPTSASWINQVDGGSLNSPEVS